jgi:hypothetical protein
MAYYPSDWRWAEANIRAFSHKCEIQDANLLGFDMYYCQILQDSLEHVNVKSLLYVNLRGRKDASEDPKQT